MFLNSVPVILCKHKGISIQTILFVFFLVFLDWNDVIHPYFFYFIKKYLEQFPTNVIIYYVMAILITCTHAQ